MFAPALALTIAAGALFVGSERVRLAADIQESAQSVARVLDREIALLRGVAQTLASTPTLRRGELGAFEEFARRGADDIGHNVLVRDLDGQQLVNVRLPPGSALPRVPLEPEELAIAPGDARVGDVYAGAVAQRPLVSVSTRTRRTGSRCAWPSRSRPRPRSRPKRARAADLCVQHRWPRRPRSHLRPLSRASRRARPKPAGLRRDVPSAVTGARNI